MKLSKSRSGHSSDDDGERRRTASRADDTRARSRALSDRRVEHEAEDEHDQQEADAIDERLNDADDPVERVAATRPMASTVAMRAGHPVSCRVGDSSSSSVQSGVERPARLLFPHAALLVVPDRAGMKRRRRAFRWRFRASVSSPRDGSRRDPAACRRALSSARTPARRSSCLRRRARWRRRPSRLS